MGEHRLAFVLAIVVLVPATLVTEGASSAVERPRVITSEERWEDVDRTVTRNIVVADGGRLVISNSTLDLRIEEVCTPARINGMYCQPEVNVRDGGELVVRNSSLTSSFSDIYELPYIQADGGTLTILDSELSSLGPVRAQFDGTMIFRNNTVTDHIASVGVWRGSDGVVAENRFEGGHAAVTVRDAYAEVRNNAFVDVDGISLAVRQSVVGDKAYTADALVVDNVFLSPEQGIFADSGAGIVIAHNHFEDARFHGVHVRVPVQDDEFTMLDDEPPRIEANVFVNNSRAVRVITPDRDFTEKRSRVQVTGNVILGSDCDHIEAAPGERAPITVDARYNWWGTDEGPPAPDQADKPHCEAFDGPGTFETRPWLQERPSNAGPR